MNDNILYHARSTPAPAAPRRAIMPDRSLTYSKVGAPPVPAQPAWFHQLDEILEAPQTMGTIFILSVWRVATTQL